MSHSPLLKCYSKELGINKEKSQAFPTGGHPRVVYLYNMSAGMCQVLHLSARVNIHTTRHLGDRISGLEISHVNHRFNTTVVVWKLRLPRTIPTSGLVRDTCHIMPEISMLVARQDVIFTSVPNT